MPGETFPPRELARTTAAASSCQRDDDITDEVANSDDELEQPFTLAERAEAERIFEERLASRGLHIRRITGDGNCLFRAVADRVYADAEMHDVVRRLCLDHMEKERDHFSQYVTEDFDAYIRRKRQDRVFGNHLEIQVPVARPHAHLLGPPTHLTSPHLTSPHPPLLQAISEIYNRPVHVYDVHGDATTPMNAFTAPTEGEVGAPLQLAYHGRSHYNVIVDPARADVGVGLGLPGYEPGLADRMQVDAALDASESSALETELLYAARDASDLDATQDALLAAALRESATEAGVVSYHGTGGTGWGSSSEWAGNGTSDWADEGYEGSLKPGTQGSADFSHLFAEPVHIKQGASNPCLSGLAPSAAEGGISAGSGLGGGGGNEQLSSAVRQLMAMGFSLPRAVQAEALFGDDMDSMLEYLTND